MPQTTTSRSRREARGCVPMVVHGQIGRHASGAWVLRRLDSSMTMDLASWNVLSGVLRVDFAGRADDPTGDGASSTRVAFLARKVPWRSALVRLGSDDDNWPDMLASAGDAPASAILSVGGIEFEVEESVFGHGDLGLRALLDIAWLRNLIGEIASDELVVEGSMLELRSLASNDALAGAALIQPGADRYRIAIDRQLGVISEWTVEVQGHVVWHDVVTPVLVVD